MLILRMPKHLAIARKVNLINRYILILLSLQIGIPAIAHASVEKDISDNPVPNHSSEYIVLLPSNHATISSDITGSVLKVLVKQGSKFKKGDLLVELDCRVQEAELKQAKARQDAASIAFKSAEKMKSYGSISELEYVKARSDNQAAHADVEKIEAIVDKCTINAPYTGAVSLLKVHDGDSVKPGDVILKIISMEELNLEMQIPSAWLKWLRVDSTFQVHINELDKTYSAKIVRIDPLIDSISQTVKVIGVITDPDQSLLPGMSGKAIFPEIKESRDKAKVENGK